MVGAATVTVVDCVTLPRVAATFDEPAAMAVTNPFVSTVATEVEDELHVTNAVKSRLLPSL